MTFDDGVWARVVQIVQEAILTGVDCTDLLRQVRVVLGDSGSLSLSPSYEKQVKEMHARMLQHAKDLQANNPRPKFIVPGGSTN